MFFLIFSRMPSIMISCFGFFNFSLLDSCLKLKKSRVWYTNLLKIVAAWNKNYHQEKFKFYSYINKHLNISLINICMCVCVHALVSTVFAVCLSFHRRTSIVYFHLLGWIFTKYKYQCIGRNKTNLMLIHDSWCEVYYKKKG